MNEIVELSAGVVRTSRPMNDGRTIRYYDTAGQKRTAQDERPQEEQPGIGELRLDPLVNEWVAMAAHRQGRIFLPPKELCPLCPTSGELLTEIPEKDFEVVVFDNRSPSLRAPNREIEVPSELSFETPPIPAAGKCEVVCFTSNYDSSFKDLSDRQIRTVLEAWRDRVSELSQIDYIEHIAPFENRGEEVGVTLAHPHGQIYAYPYLPPRTEKMLAVALAHKSKTGRILQDDVIAREIGPQFKKELNCLAENIYYEAGSESFEGKLAVAQVTLNRVASGQFANSICAVVHQKTGETYQFSWVGMRNKKIKEDKPETKVIITRADSGQGHTGTVYQATGAIYLGKSKDRMDLWDKKQNKWLYRKRELEKYGFETVRDAVKDAKDNPNSPYKDTILYHWYQHKFHQQYQYNEITYEEECLFYFLSLSLVFFYSFLFKLFLLAVSNQCY